MNARIITTTVAIALSTPTFAQEAPWWVIKNGEYSNLPIGAEYTDSDSIQSISPDTTIHVCGSYSYGPYLTRDVGGYVVGVHAKQNRLLCAKSASMPIGRDDWNTHRYGMHACPMGFIMVGINIGRNVLRCAAPSDGRILHLETERPAYWGDRSGMHACPTGWVITGIHVKNNQHLCTATSGVGSGS